jgi:nucleotide-binding universal stress UspA family protein
MYQRILVPIDGSSTANRGVDEAIRLARLAGAKVRLLHVLDELIFVTGFETGATYINDLLPKLKEGGEAILEDARRRVEAAGVPVETHLMECLGSRTSDIVVEQANAWKADLIVLGTHGRRGIGRWVLGSDAEQILRSAKVPVLLVRGEPEAQDRVARSAAETAASAAARIATATV